MSEVAVEDVVPVADVPGGDVGGVERADAVPVVDAPGGDEDFEGIFSFDVDAADDGEGAVAGGDGQAVAAAADDDDVFSIDEGSDIPQGYAEGLGAIAKELGVSGSKGALLVQRAWDFAKAQQEVEFRRLGAELKQEWGGEFDAKVGATVKFAAQLGRRAGLSNEQLGPLMSPYGFRLLNAMREMVQEGGGFAGAAHHGEPGLTAEQEIDQIFNDPKLFRSLTDLGDPEHDAVNARLNRLMGLI